ncbi:DNA/RNA non-specific endonuclease [Pseudomonas vanderleydeniana]|uniref:DNA/RNA non-specific endonuclease n=1 Tax=Pseudomonas vanderleydeniana TaxID=2745495 RepID=UPI0021F2CD70|nr:DNA/RNA non-specific endonuclease [Pseudomonas vanderleydeniana]
MKTDRGHQANLASMAGVSDWQMLNELNNLSNITAQKSDLNQGAWARLEDKERTLVKQPGIGSVYVLTGTLYERYIGTLPSTTQQLPLPSGCWKILFTHSTPTEGTFAAFILDRDTPSAPASASPGHRCVDRAAVRIEGLDDVVGGRTGRAQASSWTVRDGDWLLGAQLHHV